LLPFFMPVASQDLRYHPKPLLKSSKTTSWMINRRGRKKNQTYNRRTDSEIRNDTLRQQQLLASRRQSFFAPHVPILRRAPSPNEGQPIMQPNSSHPPSPPVIERSINDPLPGVDMRNIPPLLREPIGKVMCELRSRMKASTRQSNQYQRFTTGSEQFPWLSEEYQSWPNPLMLSRPPTAVDFVLPKFGRLRWMMVILALVATFFSIILFGHLMMPMVPEDFSLVADTIVG